MQMVGCPILAEFLKNSYIPVMQAWKRICEASRKEFDLIYQRLGVTIQERGESFYNPLLGPLVSELHASGVAEESEGAMVLTSKSLDRKAFETHHKCSLQGLHALCMTD